MFLKGLKDIQQKVFLGLARQVIMADAGMSRQERDMITALSEEMGQHELIPDPSDDVLRTVFPDPRSRTAVMLELIGLAACDGRVAAAENKIIRHLQKVFGIAGHDMTVYKDWVGRFFALMAEAGSFLAGRANPSEERPHPHPPAACCSQPRRAAPRKPLAGKGKKARKAR